MLAVACAVPVQAGSAPSPAGARTFFVNLKDGDTVANPVKVVFGIEGMKIAPALTHDSGTGHFHLFIDAPLTLDMAQFAIPNDDHHLHYGKGQTEAAVSLAPGKHVLQIVLGDGNHELHDPPVVSQPITITVK